MNFERKDFESDKYWRMDGASGTHRLLGLSLGLSLRTSLNLEPEMECLSVFTKYT